MDRRPLVSVVMPFLNAEKFIEEAIESVLTQTYDNWELLLVDDASTDGSAEIAKRHVRQYPEKVRYLQHSDHQNHGVAASRNLGVSQARGELMAFLDQDDVWLPQKMARQVAIFQRYPAVALVYSALYRWYENGEREPLTGPLFPGVNPRGFWVIKMLENIANGVSPSAVMLRKTVCTEVGGFEESQRGLFQLFEDTAMWCKIALKSPIYYDPEYLLLYRVHGISCWGRASYHELQFARMYFYSWLFRYISVQADLQFSAELFATKVKVYGVLVQYLVDNMQYDAGLALVRSLEQQTPNRPLDAEWNYLSAFCLHNLQSNLKEALSRYDCALENGFDEFWVRYNRGSLHAHLGNLKEAREDLERAIELNPGHDGAQLVLTQLSQNKET